MEAQGGNAQLIAKKLSDDSVACSVGIDERNEYNFLFALSNGYVAIKDEDTPDALLRLNFNYFPKNTFGATVKNEISLEDIKRVIAKADADGNTIIQICIAKSMYDKLRQTQGAKELVANYNGQSFTAETILPTPTATKFNEAFADDNNGIAFKVIDRSVIFEQDSKKRAMKPWNANRLVFICNEVVGTLVYGRLAEQSNPVKNVNYQLVDTFKLISKYSLVNPLREITSGQAFVAPIIEDVDQIYILDVSEAQAVDTTEEGKDSTDKNITIWGQAYIKANFVAEFNKITGKNLSTTIPDDKLIAAVNKLNDADEAKLKKAVESYKTTNGDS